jgi:hypothetical protein
MNPSIRNILAVIAGIIVGGAVNMGIIMLSSAIIAPPAGIDPTDMESLKSNTHLFEARHFIMPFLAHALGTLFGAFLTAKIAATNKKKLALTIGVFFLLGGIANAFMLPALRWFLILDLGFAYIPMAWLGGRWATEKN